MQHATFNADDLPVTSYASRLHPPTLYIELHITISRLLPTVFLDGTSLRIVGSTAHCIPRPYLSQGALTRRITAPICSHLPHQPPPTAALLCLIATRYYRTMPSPTTPYSKPSQPAQVGRSRSDVSLMRDKNGCITCRVRQKVSILCPI